MKFIILLILRQSKSRNLHIQELYESYTILPSCPALTGHLIINGLEALNYAILLLLGWQ